MTNTQQLFNDKSHIYALARPNYPSSWYTYLSNAVQADAVVWDAACGNGQAAYDLALRFAKVYATDISENQIAHAKQADNIIYSVQPSETTNFADNQFDLICVAQALHWFDYSSFWSEVKRVLKPGGLFAAWGYSWFNINAEIDDCIEQYLLRVIQSYWAEQNKILWYNFKDVPFPFTAIRSAAFDMNVHYNLEELMIYLHSWSAVGSCMQAQGSDFFINCRKQLAAIWGDPGQRQQLKMPMCTLVGKNS